MGVWGNWGATIVGTQIGSLTAAIGDEARLSGDPTTAVADIAFDHRHVVAGGLFACVPGATVDGHDLAAEAIASGATSLLCERPLDLAVPQIIVPNVRNAMGSVASAFFRHPSHDVEVVGLTGTNGKTTSAFLLDAAARAQGAPAGLIGTVETHLPDGSVRPAERTTPEAFDLQRLLREMADGGAQRVAMEVSSEGLASMRAESTRFACGVFTNLTQDHLNTHGTMERYFAAKLMLFRASMSARAVVGIDDPWGRRVAEAVTQPLMTFGTTDDADVRPSAVDLGPSGSRFTAHTPVGTVGCSLRLPGPFNVLNALGVFAVAASLGWDLETTASGMADLRSVPGRMEAIDEGQSFAVLVDYAHTPDALDGVLRAARHLVRNDGRLICVFGCGGDRDRGKRPQMGRAAAMLADRAIITSDNPRSEDPQAIVDQVATGARETGRPAEVIVDRTEAIVTAIEDAGENDVVVIAGKGHETGQQFADRTVPFDDRLVARDALRGRAR